MRGRKLQLIIGIILSIFFLWLAFRRVDFSRLWLTIRGINYWWTIPFMVLTIMGMYARALRWHYLLLPDFRISGHRLFSPLIIGFAFNNIFPARAGEFARAYVVGKKEKMSFVFALATIVVERIIDGLVIIASFAIALAFMPEFDPSISFYYDNRTRLSGETILIIINVLMVIMVLLGVFFLVMAEQGLRRSRCSAQNPGRTNAVVQQGFAGRVIAKLEKWGNLRRWRVILICFSMMTIFILAGVNVFRPLDLTKVYVLGSEYTINAATLQAITKKTLLVILGLLAVLILLLINRTRQLFQAIIQGMPGLPQRLKEALIKILNSFAKGLHSLQNIRALIPILFYSILAWVIVGFSLQLMSWGFHTVEMNLAQGMAIMVIICVAISVPSAPGFWGLYEFGALMGLKALGVLEDESLGMGYALIIHAFQVIPIVAVGLFFAWREHISLRQISQVKEEESYQAI